MNDIFPKKTLRKLKAYRPAVSESKGKDVIRLSVNEGALGPSPLATKAIEEWATKKHFFHSGFFLRCAKHFCICRKRYQRE